MSTLESRYDERIQQFLERKRSIPELELNIAECEKRVSETCINASPDEHFALLDRMKSLRQELATAMSNNDEIQYILDVIPYIQQYNAPEAPSSTQSAVTRGMDSFVHVATRTNRSEIFQSYMVDIEKKVEYSRMPAKPPIGATSSGPGVGAGGVRKGSQHAASALAHKYDDTICPECDANCLVNMRESLLMCPRCGLTRYFIECSEHNMSYAEEMSMGFTTSFSYKRLNHFTEWLNALQAREHTVIPDEILDALRSEFKKHRATTRGEINPTKIREFLKKLGHTKYYEHCHHICALLNGTPPPRLPPELETKLKKMFADIQAPFEKHCPSTRKNFLSYSYVLYKFCQLLGEDTYLEYFPLLKSSEKLHAQDIIFKGICKELSWEFIPSV
jgi:hypothetical protein